MNKIAHIQKQCIDCRTYQGYEIALFIWNMKNIADMELDQHQIIAATHHNAPYSQQKIHHEKADKPVKTNLSAENRLLNILESKSKSHDYNTDDAEWLLQMIESQHKDGE